jgi:predicted nucleic acid-binding protein
MSAEPFVDTNIWVYAHTEEPGDLRGSRAKGLVEDGRRFLISTQVLSEYYAAMLKNGASDALIQQNIEAMVLRCDLRLVDLSVIRLAHRIKPQYRFSYWDSLVIASALDASCELIYTEDLQHGQLVEGTLRIVNPFLEAGG